VIFTAGQQTRFDGVAVVAVGATVVVTVAGGETFGFGGGGGATG